MIAYHTQQLCPGPEQHHLCDPRRATLNRAGRRRLGKVAVPWILVSLLRRRSNIRSGRSTMVSTGV